MQPLALGLAKLSLLLFYRRIFRGTVFNAISWIVIFIVAGWMTADFFLNIFQCREHVWMAWDPPKDYASYCYPGETLALTFASLDVVTDVIILVQPIYWVSILFLLPGAMH